MSTGEVWVLIALAIIMLPLFGVTIMMFLYELNELTKQRAERKAKERKNNGR